MKYKYIFMTDNKIYTRSHPVLSLGRVQWSLCVKAEAFVPQDSVLCDVGSCWFSSFMCQHSNLQYFNVNAVTKIKTHINVDWDMWEWRLHYIFVKLPWSKVFLNLLIEEENL